MRTYSIKLAEEVYERDQWCIICGRGHNLTIAHVKNKGMGGTKRKDTADNLVCLCLECHNKMDNGIFNREYRQRCEQYLKDKYSEE